MAEPLAAEITAAICARFPMLDPLKATELADLALEVVDRPTRIGSLPICRICRAPLRLAEKPPGARNG